jgi:hypothetical protein
MKKGLKTYTLVSMLALAGALGAPEMANAQAACGQWNVGSFNAVQGATTVYFNLKQRGKHLNGTGSYVHRGDTILGFGGKKIIDGDVEGAIDGNSIELETQWGGVYLGTIDATGRIDGTTYDKNDSTSSARWYSDRRMNCLARVVAPPPPPVAQPIPLPPQPVGDYNSGVLTSGRGSLGSSVFASSSRAAPAPVPAAAPAPMPTPIAVPFPANGFGTTCKQGFVRRSARATDLICVTPASRDRVAAENRTKASRVQPGGGYYGPNTCRSGFVWREAFVGDLVCVTPERRSRVAQENQIAATRANLTRKS